jgi:hypothetical protein
MIEKPVATHISFHKSINAVTSINQDVPSEDTQMLNNPAATVPEAGLSSSTAIVIDDDGSIVTEAGPSSSQMNTLAADRYIPTTSVYGPSVTTSPVSSQGFKFKMPLLDTPTVPVSVSVPVPAPSSSIHYFPETVPEKLLRRPDADRPTKRKVLDVDDKEKEIYEQQKAALVKARARKKELREAYLTAKAKGLVPPSVRLHAVNEFPLILDSYAHIRQFDIRKQLRETSTTLPFS